MNSLARAPHHVLPYQRGRSYHKHPALVPHAAALGACKGLLCGGRKRRSSLVGWSVLYRGGERLSRTVQRARRGGQLEGHTPVAGLAARAKPNRGVGGGYARP
jgi:hypothetical protein